MARPTSVLDDLGTDALYNVVYLFYMFEAFTDLKIRIEPYVCIFLEYLCVFSCISLWLRKYVW